MKIKPSILYWFLLGLISCNSNAQTKIQTGTLSSDVIYFEYAIYFSGESAVDSSFVAGLIKEKYPEVEVLNTFPESENVSGAKMLISEVTNVQEDFLPPDLEYLKFASNGLSDEQKMALQGSKFAIVFDFFCEESRWMSTFEMANLLMLDLAKNTNDIIWDSETREAFSRFYWKENRLVKKEGINVSRHITIHLYQKNEYCRAITLGMLKFGLPEICIENLSCHNTGNISNLINLTAQTILENPKIERKGKLFLDIDLIKNEELKGVLESSLINNAQRKSEINILQGTWEEGDTDNRILEIGFSNKNPQVEHDQLMTKIFGAPEDEVEYLTHDDELLAASQRAKDKLPALYLEFSAGLTEEGTSLLMKFPFENLVGEQEWMWVEVLKWEDNKVTGLLQNDPRIVKGLKFGQEVTKDERDMFDYIIYYPDGTEEGNETGKIISKQQKD
ncbi:MAG: DUF2314 domain-containing protein [Bacteroidetes bacterium]|nr:MAG: DUF2314 domain-containing protein [Bacteroidota bacterium]